MSSIGESLGMRGESRSSLNVLKYYGYRGKTRRRGEDGRHSTLHYITDGQARAQRWTWSWTSSRGGGARSSEPDGRGEESGRGGGPAARHRAALHAVATPAMHPTATPRTEPYAHARTHAHVHVRRRPERRDSTPEYVHQRLRTVLCGMVSPSGFAHVARCGVACEERSEPSQ